MIALPSITPAYRNEKSQKKFAKLTFILQIIKHKSYVFVARSIHNRVIGNSPEISSYLSKSMWHSQNPSTDERNENVGEDLDGILGSIVVMHSLQTGIHIPKPQ